MIEFKKMFTADEFFVLIDDSYVGTVHLLACGSWIAFDRAGRIKGNDNGYETREEAAKAILN